MVEITDGLDPLFANVGHIRHSRTECNLELSRRWNKTIGAARDPPSRFSPKDNRRVHEGLLRLEDPRFLLFSFNLCYLAYFYC